MSQLFTIRKPVPSDVEYMLKTWLREMRKAYPRSYPDRLYYNDFQQIIMQLVAKADARVICSASDPNYICGFVVGSCVAEADTMVVHFAYMRSPFRRAGLVTQALQDMGLVKGYEIVATHWSPYMDRFRINELIYNPTVLYSIKGDT
jgi:hypothetical protein